MPTLWSRIAGPLAVLVAGAALIGLIFALGTDVDHTPADTADTADAPADPAQSLLVDKHQQRWKKVYKEMRLGDLAKAEQQLVKLLQDDPDDTDARDMLQRVRAARTDGE